MKIKTKLSKNYINFRGWKTNRKIVVIESDDWGSVRIASQAGLRKIERTNSQILTSPFHKFDGLERTVDLELLFELLTQFRDINGRHPVVTALSLTSNPDFDKIRDSGMNYHSELIPQTYLKYGEDNLFKLWKKDGITLNLLMPQFHGKEHLHPERYMNRISSDQDPEFIGFKNNSILGTQVSGNRSMNFLAAFEFQSEKDKIQIENRTTDGLLEFEALFGFKSKSFCPSQSIYGDHLYDVLRKNHISTIQAGQQFLPKGLSLKKKENIWGSKTSNGLVFTRRNCTFEIYSGQHLDHVNQCLKEIEIAFRWGKPAVINSHRINFTSRITQTLRDKTLVELQLLLTLILKTWPEVEFMNSSELANLIVKDVKQD